MICHFGVSDRGCANPSDEKSEDGGDAGAEDEGLERENVLLISTMVCLLPFPSNSNKKVHFTFTFNLEYHDFFSARSERFWRSAMSMS